MQKSFIREKKIYCGSSYREVDIFPYTENKRKTVKNKRKKHKFETAPKQKRLNDKNSERYLIQIGNLNFGNDPEAIHLTLTYNNKNIPSTLSEAEKEVRNFIRRVRYRRKQKGVAELKYILVTSYRFKNDVDEEAGEKPVRIHHHLLMNGGLKRDEVEAMWTKKRINWNKYEADEKYRHSVYENSLGFVNADRLQANESGITALCKYFVKQARSKGKRIRKWNSSTNLQKPTSSTNDSKYRRRQLEKLARERPGREYWEKKYPGWTLTDLDNGVSYKFNEFTGWAIYLKLRKKE